MGCGNHGWGDGRKPHDGAVSDEDEGAGDAAGGPDMDTTSGEDDDDDGTAVDAGADEIGGDQDDDDLPYE
ncbi:hypothetical protein SAMN05444365_104185 [Micromonospora pattaloongensis]|uniref:Uncharacterized protein n=1 Tax=Micromonospora pattaloongensis TaxID=405436 RepID=A0A1H3NW11_9ACTN|nr:hypothetical protein SAMN05444365_104185 [Micromonospora pattaloongensis]